MRKEDDKKKGGSVATFWQRMDDYFKETVRVGFNHSSEWAADTVIRQLVKVAEGKLVYVCDTGRATLPLSGYDAEWAAVGAYLEANSWRPRCVVLTELKLVATGVRDDSRLSESCKLLPLN